MWRWKNSATPDPRAPVTASTPSSSRTWTQAAAARGYARDFLAGLLEVARRQNKDIAPIERQVIFGVPSEASAAWRDALSAIAREAGYGDIKTVDEPKGAIYFHIQRKDITPIEALTGALVVDFGGGTCDFVMAGGEVMHSWGDMHLGGRLFDDLLTNGSSSRIRGQPRRCAARGPSSSCSRCAAGR